jgi:undecaprenyl-diphosphatase
MPPPRRLTVVAIVGAVAVLVTLPAGLAGTPGAVDERLFRWLNDPAGLFGLVLELGGPIVRPVGTFVLVVVVVVVLLVSEGRWVVPGLVAAAVAGGVAAVVVNLMKPAVARGRPPTHLDAVLTHGYPGDPRGLSYPSSHTATVVAVVVTLWPWLSRPWRVVAVAVAVLIGLSRAYVGAHFPSDILGGAGVGLLVGAAALAALDRLAQNAR